MKFQLSSTKKQDDKAHRIYLTQSKSISKISALSKDELAYAKKQLEGESDLLDFNKLDYRILIVNEKSENNAEARLENARVAGNKAFAFLKSNKISNIQIIVSGMESEYAESFLEGLLLSAYEFKKYFSAKDAAEKTGKISIVGDLNFKSVEQLAQAVHLTKDLVNEPFNKLGVAEFVKQTKAMASESGIKFEAFNKKKIESLKMGGLLAVNQASLNEPAFVVLEYKGAKAKNKKPVIFVGKGVVYDTGGASLKPSNGMETMKCDMAGAAAVVGSIKAIADAKLPVHVIGLIPLTDNAIGNAGIVPGDVITMSNGKTVEVLNTDAEGRLILADALTYAQKLNPEIVIDLATLTGAAVRAIGDVAIAAMEVNAGKHKTSLDQASSNTFERLVWFPMWKEYGEMIKSDIADIKNLGGPEAGQITAAKFLEHFTNYPWIHLDIAGPAFLPRPSAYRSKGATAVGVRLLYNFVKNL